MRLSFHKMHGLGNDFVVIDGRSRPIEMTSPLARALADRKTGVGCDQLILIDKSDRADAAMRIFNADGGEVEACGNAARCVAMLLGGEASIDTPGGLISGKSNGSGATLDMGAPRFDWDVIPLAHAMDTADMPVGWDDLDHPAAVNVGNPHIVFFVDDCDAVDLESLGPTIEHDPLFPQRINVNVAQVTGQNALKLRVWERGVGETRACGTGACATAVVAVRRKLVSSPVTVSLPGGDLTIEWAENESIHMTGPAAHVFDGEIDLEAFA